MPMLSPVLRLSTTTTTRGGACACCRVCMHHTHPPRPSTLERQHLPALLLLRLHHWLRTWRVRAADVVWALCEQYGHAWMHRLCVRVHAWHSDDDVIRRLTTSINALAFDHPAVRPRGRDHISLTSIATRAARPHAAAGLCAIASSSLYDVTSAVCGDGAAAALQGPVAP